MLRLQSLTRHYQVGENVVRALDGVSLHVKKGELVAIMGPSGSGKSTLLNLLGCLDTPTTGSYQLANREVSNLDDDSLSRIRNSEIGFVFQSFNLLPRLTARQNVELPLVYAGVGRHERHERAAEMLRLVRLEERMSHRPSQMSGGQCQRVAIARALVNRPSILLADEPTGNLDSSTSAEILDFLKDLHRRGNTIVLVTHDDDVGRHADRIIRFNDGRIAPPSEPVADAAASESTGQVATATSGDAA